VAVGWPLIDAIYLSFTNAQIGEKVPKFVGLYNFINLLKDSTFLTAAYNSILFTVVSVFLKMIIGIGIALLLYNFKQKWLRAIVLLPWVIPSTFGILGWLWILDPLYGSLNWLLIHSLGFSIPWLAEPFWARTSVILVNTWRGIPFFAIGFLGGMIAIPRDIYEAAKIDGSNSIHSFWYITLPLLMPVILIISLFSIVMTISDFSVVYILTRGGPINSTQVFATLTYQVGLSGAQIGRGAAISLFILPVLIVLAIIMLRYVNPSKKGGLE